MAETMMASPSKSEHGTRKNKKPLMEKRRRARINSCLSQLKSLVLQAIKKDSSQFSKLEKADILELTVKHLRALQRQQAAGVMTQDPNVVSKYRAGFNECAKEVVRYMGAVREVNEEVKERVVGHLANCMQVVNHVTPMETLQQQQLKPLHVHIPQQQQQPISGSVATSSVIMHAPPPSLHAFSAASVRPTSTSSSLDSLPPSPVTATPLSSLPVQSLPAVAGRGEVPRVAAGAFKIVPSSTGGAVAIYVGGGVPQRGDSVSVDAVPLYSVTVPDTPTVQPTAFVPPSPLRMDTHSHSHSHPHSHSHAHQTSSGASSPEREEYHHCLPVSAPAVSLLPVDLRSAHKVKAFRESSPPPSHSSSRYSPDLASYSPFSVGQCRSPLAEDKMSVWRPW